MVLGLAALLKYVGEGGPFTVGEGKNEMEAGTFMI